MTPTDNPADLPAKRRPLILVTNDDSVKAPGLFQLIDLLRPLGEVVGIAPREPRSGQSSAFTTGPVQYDIDHYQGSAPVFSVTGTPVDCVKLGIHTILRHKPDFVVAGINHGSNAGNCVVYSGTMGAVLEGCMEDIPSVGFSLTHHSWQADFTPVRPWVKKIMERVVAEGLPDYVCLNVNFPARCTIEGLKVTRAARGYWSDEYEAYTDPHGRPFFWIAGSFINQEPDAPDTDEYWLRRHYATVVPVTPDMTARRHLESTAALMGGMASPCTPEPLPQGDEPADNW